MVAYNPHLRVEDVQSGYDIGYKNTSQNMGFYWFVPFSDPVHLPHNPAS